MVGDAMNVIVVSDGFGGLDMTKVVSMPNAEITISINKYNDIKHVRNTMKLAQIYENEEDVVIVKYTLDDSMTEGLHRVDTVIADGSDIVKLFGEPITKGDTTMWIIDIDYREKGEDYGVNNEDFDTARTTLYDYRDNEWAIGGRNWMDGYVLKVLLAENGVIK